MSWFLEGGNPLLKVNYLLNFYYYKLIKFYLIILRLV